MGKKVYMKVVGRDQIYNFVVEKTFESDDKRKISHHWSDVMLLPSGRGGYARG